MTNKQKKYARIYDQLKDLLSKNTNFLAQLSTINAILYHKYPSFFWVGFYLKYKNRLLVGPYQGPVACQELEYQKGVCWAGVIEKKPIIVKNVEEFPDHIACDSRSKSEIVLPIKNSKGNIVGVLDIDSDKLDNFDNSDIEGLQQIISLLRVDFIDQFLNN